MTQSAVVDWRGPAQSSVVGEGCTEEEGASSLLREMNCTASAVVVSEI